MKVNAVGVHVPVLAHPTGKSAVKFNNANVFSKLKVISLSEYQNSPISFTGTRNKEQAIFIGAESAPYAKAGGVGVVMKDYRSFSTPNNQVEIIPYYGADANPRTGEILPIKDKDGDYILPDKNGGTKLELVSEKEMQWGKRRHNKIMLFNIKGDEDKSTYFVFTNSTAPMKKPYQSAYVYSTGAKSETNEWNGDPYAQFSKAAVEFIPDVINNKKDFNPATVICSDSQTAYVHEYMAKKAVNDTQKDDYDGIKPTYVGHNMGPGYCGETSKQNMFVNLGATPEQIELVESDPIFKDRLLGDDYFTPFVEKTIDETGTASAVMIPIHYSKKTTANGEGYSKAFTVVAEDYAANLAQNPQAAHNIYNNLKQLYTEGSFNGILNPLEDVSVDATKPLPNALYNVSVQDRKTGKIYEAMKLYPKNPTFSEMKDTKNFNKSVLFERLFAKDTAVITGDSNRSARINPEGKDVYDGPIIKDELMSLVREGKGDKVPLFISWGRSDTQKGHDITLNAFEKFAKTKEGKNAVLILGTELDKSNESKKLEAKIKDMLNDPDLQGRIVHIDGWAPAYALASAADAAIFSSRFEPCGLTDLEAMKYYCTPIVTNTQGFKQKNFDPRIENEKEKATSFKTQHEYNLLKAQVAPIIDAYVNDDETALEKVKKEFPVFETTDENGKKVYNDIVFREFADKYSEFIENRKASIEATLDEDEELPPGWNDWDQLSKDYSFKFTGFARDLKDGILAAEMADSIGAFVKTDDDTKETIFKNLSSLQTGWRTNGALHPDGKSSYEKYKELHLDPEYSSPQKEDILAKDDAFITSKIEDRQHKDLKGRIGAYLAGSLTGLAGILFTKSGSNQFKAREDELLQQISQLKSTLAKTKQINKKYLIITGITSAIGASVVSLLGSKYIKNRLSQNKESHQTSELVLPPNPTKGMTPQFNSLENFKNNINP